MSKSRSGAPRRIAAGLLAGALSVVGIALAPPAGAVDDVNADRLAGINRYGTAAAIAGQDDFDGATTAILATGETFPDALAASGLAGANAPAPIILTESNTYSNEAAEALNNLTSITDVIIVGGTAAVSQGVEDAVAADGFTVSRVAGADRYATAAEIAEEMGAAGDVGGLATAFIATGTNFADALAGGPLAYALGSPILLVTPTEVPAATSAAIASLGVEQVVILGGTAAVGNDVEAELEDATGNDAVRVADVNRFGTAAAVGEFAVDTAELGWAPTEVLLASGLNFPDALAGGPLGGARNAPVLLTASLPEETEAFLDAHSDTIDQITALGGTGVIDEATLNDAEDAAEAVENDDEDTPVNQAVTDAPELLSAAFVSQPATGTTTVRFTFDEAVTGQTPQAGRFHLYTNGMTVYNGTGAQVETGNTSAVLVTFATTADQFGQVVLATVDADAVRDATGTAAKANPEGDAPLSSQSAAAGSTTAPDLVSVGNFRANATGDGVLVDFTFDEAAFTNAAVAITYRLITAANTEIPLANDVFNNGTTTHTVNFGGSGGPTLNTTQVNALTIARGLVETAGVRDAAGNTNPLQIAEANGSGNTSGPDLVSVTFNQDATNTVGGAIDQATYEFDEPIATPTAASFCVYTVNGGAPTCNATGATRSSTNDTQVVVTFPDGTLANAVGASIDDGAGPSNTTGLTTGGGTPAVTAATGDTTRVSQEDEVAVQGVTFAAGRTTGPDLIGARLETATANTFTGAVATYQVVYTFDETINITIPTPGNFKVYTGTTTAVGGALPGAAATAFVTGASAGCSVTRSTTNTSEAILSCGAASTLTPTNALLNGGFVLATVELTNGTANGAVPAAGSGAVSDGTFPNPEGSELITQPTA